MNEWLCIGRGGSVNLYCTFIHSFIPVFDPLLFSRQSKAESRVERAERIFDSYLAAAEQLKKMKRALIIIDVSFATAAM